MPKKINFDDKVVDRIVELYVEKCFRISEIARLLECSVVPVTRVLRDKEVPLRSQGDELKTTRNQKIMDLHDAGYSFAEIGTTFGVSRQRIYQVVQRGY